MTNAFVARRDTEEVELIHSLELSTIIANITLEDGDVGSGPVNDYAQGAVIQEISTATGVGTIYRPWIPDVDYIVAVDTPSATDFSATEALSWTNGTGTLHYVDDVNAATLMHIELLTGVPPAEGLTITGGTSGATCVVNVKVKQTGTKPFGCLLKEIDHDATITRGSDTIEPEYTQQVLRLGKILADKLMVWRSGGWVAISHNELERLWDRGIYSVDELS